MYIKKIAALSVFFLKFSQIISQETESAKLTLNGYINDMQSVIFSEIKEDWITDNLIHNRLNCNWFVSEHFTASLQLRNRFVWGEMLQSDSSYAGDFDLDHGLIDLSGNIIAQQSFLLNSTIDRLWFAYEKGKLSIKAGRQRINWGQNFGWNPNDIFNVYSFFDFDYIERPGSDAIRIQYYTGMASSVELATKIDKNRDVTSALLFRFNKWNFDFQLLGGFMNSDDYVFGGGWTGNIGGAGFSGECCYFIPIDDSKGGESQLITAIGGNYMFSNSLMLQCELLYSDIPDDLDINNFAEFYNGPLSVKNISFTPFTFLGNVSFPVTPLLNFSASAMFFSKIDGYAIVPAITYSLAENIDFDFIVQGFSGKLEDENGNKIQQNFNLAFLRLKYNF